MIRAGYGSHEAYRLPCPGRPAEGAVLVSCAGTLQKWQWSQAGAKVWKVMRVHSGHRLCSTKWGEAVRWPRHSETQCCTPPLSPLITVKLKAAPALDNSPASSYPTPGPLFQSEDLAYLTENIGTFRLAYSQISRVKDHMAPLRSGTRRYTCRAQTQQGLSPGMSAP